MGRKPKFDAVEKIDIYKEYSMGDISQVVLSVKWKCSLEVMRRAIISGRLLWMHIQQLENVKDMKEINGSD